MPKEIQMMKTIHPTVLTDEQIASLGDPSNIALMLQHGSAYEKAMATAFQSLDGDTRSQKQLLTDMFEMFSKWVA